MKPLITSILLFFLFVCLFAGTAASTSLPTPNLKDTISKSDLIVHVTVTSVTYESVDDTDGSIILNISNSDADTIFIMQVDDILKGELNANQIILHTDVYRSTFKEGDQLVFFLRKISDNTFSLTISSSPAIVLKDPQSEKYVGLFNPSYNFTESELKTSIDHDAKPSIMTIIKNYFQSLFSFFKL